MHEEILRDLRDSNWDHTRKWGAENVEHAKAGKHKYFDEEFELSEKDTFL